MPEENENSLVSHLEALRRMLLRIVIVTALLYPAGYVLAPYAIDALVCWCCPPEIGRLHYFAPMEVFFCAAETGIGFRSGAGISVEHGANLGFSASGTVSEGTQGAGVVDSRIFCAVFRRHGILCGIDSADADVLFGRFCFGGIAADAGTGEFSESGGLADAGIRSDV